MLKPEKIDEFVRQFQALLPEDARQARDNVEKNVRSMMTASLRKMDLVTREEFDVQSELLSRTREELERLEQKIRELEANQGTS